MGRHGKPSNSFIADVLDTALLIVGVPILRGNLIYSCDVDNEILQQVHLKCIELYLKCVLCKCLYRTG